VSDNEVLAYAREHRGRCLSVLLNLGSQPRSIALESLGCRSGRILLSTSLRREGETCAIVVRLQEDEGLVLAE
jgi:hypothetical protein